MDDKKDKLIKDALDQMDVRAPDAWKEAGKQFGKLLGAPEIKKLWLIQAQAVHERDDSWTGSTGVPTFYLDPDIQGILTAEHACRVAMKIINPFGLLKVYVSAIALDVKTGLTIESEYAALGPQDANVPTSG